MGLLCGGVGRSVASMTVLVGEPFGNFGTMMPVGHTAVYLDRVCADGPLKLKMCGVGDQPGVVVARYHRIGSLDWVASPVMEFLYAVERPEEVPAEVTADSVWAMRERYRERYMRAIVPDGKEKEKATDEWWETAGVAYNRKVWGYGIATSRAQDEEFVAYMNADANRHLYHLRKTNCADFAAEVVNFYFPGTVRADRIADFGLMTPKQVARSVAAYGATHAGADLRVIEVPQVPGTLRRSRPVRGAAESALKTKRYLGTLLAIQPEVPLALSGLYLWHGRWAIGRGAVAVEPEDFVRTGAQMAGTEESRRDAAPRPVTVSGAKLPAQGKLLLP